MVVNESNGRATENSNVSNPSGEELYLKLVKNDSKITGFYSQDGQIWTKVYEVNNTTLGSDFKVGLVETGSTARTPFTFSEFKINNTDVAFINVRTKK